MYTLVRRYGFISQDRLAFSQDCVDVKISKMLKASITTGSRGLNSLNSPP